MQDSDLGMTIQEQNRGVERGEDGERLDARFD